ncbi:hypothetical protein C8F04DRAFT_1187279 [Mycena alexandri]|uniref:Uncharacterized protein n=1 Tax=Mycena alexandri TaxID=1745969 RepID=A0AAD6SL41_9AGAR|nr:hypothetical protein C8F04DRAFT_1187279 [Mycena alexandri]
MALYLGGPCLAGPCLGGLCLGDRRVLERLWLEYWLDLHPFHPQRLWLGYGLGDGRGFELGGRVGDRQGFGLGGGFATGHQPARDGIPRMARTTVDPLQKACDCSSTRLLESAQRAYDLPELRKRGMTFLAWDGLPLIDCKKIFLAYATAEQLEEREEERALRWEDGLRIFQVCDEATKSFCEQVAHD